MYVTFNLLFLEKQTFFWKFTFYVARQQIKLRESDKSPITMKNYSINISVKIKFYYPLWDSRNFHFSHYKSIETISCHSNQSSYLTEIKNTTFVEGNVLCKYAKFQLHSPYGFWEEKFCTFFKNLPFMSPQQPIKLSNLDKSRMKHGGLLNKYFCKKNSNISNDLAEIVNFHFSQL